jgi:hypothetical protein
MSVGGDDGERFGSPEEAAGRLLANLRPHLDAHERGEVPDREALRVIAAESDRILSTDFASARDHEQYFFDQLVILEARALAIRSLASRSTDDDIVRCSDLLYELYPLLRAAGSDGSRAPSGRLLEITLELRRIDERLGLGPG